jgi:hypothetical protein
MVREQSNGVVHYSSVRHYRNRLFYGAVGSIPHAAPKGWA